MDDIMKLKSDVCIQFDLKIRVSDFYAADRH